MKITVDFTSEAAAKPEQLNEGTIQLVVNSMPQDLTIEFRLKMLRLFPLGSKVKEEYHESTPHQNAIDWQAANGGKLYIGYRIYTDQFKRYHCDVHSFVVLRNRVIDPTYHDTSARYVGMVVPERDIADLRYVSLFELPSYLETNAPFAVI